MVIRQMRDNCLGFKGNCDLTAHGGAEEEELPQVTGVQAARVVAVNLVEHGFDPLVPLLGLGHLTQPQPRTECWQLYPRCADTRMRFDALGVYTMRIIF